MAIFREQEGFPQVPPSLRHDAYETKDVRNMKIRELLSQSSAKGATPYLGLGSRLSQIWFNRWTVLLLLVLVNFLLTIGSLNGNLDDAKVKALSACTKVEDVGSAMASMPHYLSVGVNRLTASGITESVHALMTILDMILTGIEQLILFVIGMMTDTYVCLITMVVHGGLNASSLAITKTTEAMNDAIDGVAKAINSTADDLQKPVDAMYSIVNGALNAGEQATSAVGGAINTATAAVGGAIETAIGGIGDIFNKRADIPPPPEITGAIFKRVDLPPKPEVAGDIRAVAAKLSNVNINTTGFVSDLDALNQELPDFDDIKNLTAMAVSFPFNLIREQLTKAYGNWEFNDSVFPVAKKEALSFCSDNTAINDFFDGLYEIAHIAKIVAIVVLILLALAACIPMAYMEIRRWRRAQISASDAYDDMDLVYMSSRPTTARVGYWIASKFGEKRRVLVRWCIAYATSLPALFVLSLALAGFFSCFCQWILLNTMQKEIPELANQVGDFANQVVGTLDGVSQKWADDANGVITSFSTEINDDILGKVTNGTAAINDTLNTFMSEIDKGLNTVFGHTMFKDLAANTVRCLIGLKVESVQKGLTWVHDHAHINFPMFPNDVFSVGAAKSISGDSDLTSFLASPSSVTTDEITGSVTHVTDWLRSNIIQDALVATGLLLVYVIIILIGVVRTLVGHSDAEGDARRRRIQNFDPSQPAGGNPPMQMPQFSGAGDASAHPDHQTSPFARDDAFSRGTVHGGPVTTEEVPPYTRHSSYVQYGDTKRMEHDPMPPNYNGGRALTEDPFRDPKQG
ncbi:Plasma membrane fusion protein PRM1 [Daldinia childiae]|uniref:Plasma membrane fusion protein PRM1 n=1 Tax=Daldinia childiae TaxID=326645 RepID=UPI001445CC0B|nr:Plasma membrane fusion protein PRM1 [Daldinia childiae]KAF3070886.1 Plasma membrane fusion protein PRM1 [Daldinia childiae]